MKYEVDKEQLLELAKAVFEKAVTSYLDLKDTACEGLVVKFLEDKKSIVTNTNISLTSLTTFDNQIFSTNVVTLSNGNENVLTTRFS